MYFRIVQIEFTATLSKSDTIDTGAYKPAKLVLNTVIKMQRNKFSLNFYTNVLNTNFEATPGLIRIKNIGIKFGTVTINQLANTTSSVELKLSDIFGTILCAISSVRTTIPGDKNASAMTDGTTVTIYLHNNTNSVGTMWIYYIIVGVLK